MFQNFFQLSNSSLNLSFNRGDDNNDDYMQYLYENPLESFYPNNIEPNSTIEIPIKKEIQEIPNFQNTQNNQPIGYNNTQFLDSLKSNFPIPGIKENEMIDEDDDLISKKSTGDKSENNNNNITKVIFGVQTKKKFELRVDYAIKNIKVYISKYMKEYGNKLIKECNFTNRLQKAKLFLPSYQYFTGNANEKLNKTFLNLSVEEVLTYPKEKKNPKKDNRLQRQNQEIIDDLKEYIEENFGDEKPKQYQRLLDFFRMSYEDIIIEFYKSEYFKEFCEDKKTTELEKQFQKTKGFSLLEKNALIKLLKKQY